MDEGQLCGNSVTIHNLASLLDWKQKENKQIHWLFGVNLLWMWFRYIESKLIAVFPCIKLKLYKLVKNALRIQSKWLKCSKIKL